MTGDKKWIHYDNPKHKIPWPTSQINVKAEYPRRRGNALYLVESEERAVL